MATYDQFLVSDFHRKAFERANGSPAGRTRVNVKEGSPSSNMRCRNDAKGRIEPGKDAERIAFDKREKRERNKRNANAKNVDGLIAPRVIGVVIYRDGVKVEPQKRKQSPRIFHQTDIKREQQFTFVADHGSFEASAWTTTAKNKREAYEKYRKHFKAARVPSGALFSIDGKAVR